MNPHVSRPKNSEAEKERGPRVNRPFFGFIFRKVTPTERSATEKEPNPV